MRYNPISRILSLALAASLTFAPAFAADEKDTSLTGTLKSIQGGLGAVNDFTGAIGTSQQQMQAMVNQIAALQAQTGLMNQNMGELDKVKARLAIALGEAQSCMSGANKDVSKFKKNNISPASVTVTEPTCRNYGNIIDSAKANILKMNEANTKLGCMRTFQDKVNAAAESAKGPFSALTKAAQESWNIRDQIITLHKGIAEKLTNDIDGRDGYKAKLDALKKLSIELNNVLNGDSKGKSDNGLPTGLARKAEDLKRLRVSGANQWHFALMQDTQQCFYTDRSKGCDAAGTPASPYECIMRQLNQSSRNNPGLAARNKFNQGEMNEVFSLNLGKIQGIDSAANIDVKDINGFLKFSSARFQKIAVESANTLAQRKFAGNVNSADLAAYMRSKLNDCYASAVQRFKSGLDSEGNQYKVILNAVEDREKDLANDTKVWIETASNQMNEFRTAFKKVYQNDLPQFTANCTVSDDPYVSVDCMRVLSASLKAGIEGTTQSIKLGNGTYYTANEGVTVLNVQGITTDQTGKPSMSMSQVQCRGFNECLTFLEQSRTHHEEQVQTQTQEREKFVQEHNKNVDTAIQSVSAQFTAISELMGRAVGEVNENLTKAGVNAHVKTKQVDGETLSQNEKTKLYDMPKNMKSALAATGSYTELEDTAEVTTSLNARLAELNKKVAEAFRKKAQCAIKKSDYESLAGYLPNSCDDSKTICRADRTVSMMPALESLLRKSGVNADKNDSGDIAQRYRSCIAGLRGSLGDSDDLSDIKSKLGRSNLKPEDEARFEKRLQELRAEQKRTLGEERRQCGEQTLGALDALSKEARNDTLSGNNAKILKALRGLNEACANPPEFEGAVDACSEFKSAAKDAKLPEGEGETPDNSIGTTTSPSNPLRSNTGTAQ